MSKPTYDELQAQVEVLQSWLRQAAELVNLDGGTAIDWLIDNHQAMLSATKEIPSACLAQVRAEAGRAGFVAGYEAGHTYRFANIGDDLADEYADQVRQGGVE